MKKKIVSSKECMKHTTINLFKWQNNIMNKLIENKLYRSKSEVVREALTSFLSNQFIQALQSNQEKIYQEIIKAHRGKKNESILV